MEFEVVRSRLWAWYLAVVVFVGQYYVVAAYGATAGETLYVAIGVSAAVAALTALVVQRPRPLLAWIAITMSIGAYLVADAVLAQLEADNVIVPFPSLADWLYLAVYPVLIASFVVIRRSLAPGRDRRATIDAVIVGVAALGVLTPLYLMELWNSPFFDTGQRWVAVAYPVADAALLAAGARLVLAAGRRTHALMLLGAAAAAVVVGNAAYYAQSLGSGFTTGGVASVGWLAFTALLAGAALHPSARRAEPGSATTGPQVWPDGLRVLAVVAVVAAHLRWGDADSRIISAACLGTVVVLGFVRSTVGRDVATTDPGDRAEPLQPAASDFVADLPLVGAGGAPADATDGAPRPASVSTGTVDRADG